MTLPYKLIETLRGHGFDTSTIPHQPDNRGQYRFAAIGKTRGNTSAFLCLLSDGAGYHYECNVTGLSGQWFFDRDPAQPQRPDPAAIEAARVKAAQAARDRAQALAKAIGRWQMATPLSDTQHPYATRKALSGADLRVSGPDLLLPMYATLGGPLVGVQSINGAGVKSFAFGTQKKGAFCEIKGNTPTVFCEGFATGWHIHRATGRRVIVCWDAGNLKTVAPMMAQPGDCVGADNDGSGTGQKAAIATGLPWVMPPVVDTDFADIPRADTFAIFAGLEVQITAPMVAPAMRIVKPKFIDTAGMGLGKIADAMRAATTAQDASNYAQALAWRMSHDVPLTPLSDVQAALRVADPDLLPPDTVAAIMAGISENVEARKRLALNALSETVLERHNVHNVTSLDGLHNQMQSGVWLVRSPMASGKTQKILFPISTSAAQDLRYPVAVVHRVSLVDELSYRLGLPHYQDYRAVNGDANGLVVCLPSLSKRNFGPITERAQVLLIDEIAQVLRMLVASVCQRHTGTDQATAQAIYDNLCDMVRQAPLVVGCDAGLDDLTVKFLQHCRPSERFNIVIMDPQPNDIKVMIVRGANAASHGMRQIIAQAMAGKKLWVACETRRQARLLSELLKKAAVQCDQILITSKTKDGTAQRAFLEKPEVESRKYQIVIASPTISSGLSVEHKGSPHFDGVFFIGGGNAVTPSDAIQMMRRVRGTTDLTVVLTKNNKAGGAVASEMLAAKRGATGGDDIGTFDRWQAAVMASETNAKADFAAGLFWLCEAQGWDVKVIDAAGGADENIKEVRDALDRADRDALIAAPIITDAQAQEIGWKRVKSDQDHITLEAYQIRTKLGRDQITDAIIDFWDGGRGVRRTDRFAVWQKLIPVPDESKTPMMQRRNYCALGNIMAQLFEGIDISAGCNPDQARTIEARAAAMAGGWGLWAVGLAGGRVKKSNPKTGRPFNLVNDILARFGLYTKRRQTRKAGPSVTLGGSRLYGNGASVTPKGKNKPVSTYPVTPESMAQMIEAARYRHCLIDAPAQAVGVTDPVAIDAPTPAQAVDVVAMDQGDQLPAQDQPEAQAVDPVAQTVDAVDVVAMDQGYWDSLEADMADMAAAPDSYEAMMWGDYGDDVETPAPTPEAIQLQSIPMIMMTAQEAQAVAGSGPIPEPVAIQIRAHEAQAAKTARAYMQIHTPARIRAQMAAALPLLAYMRDNPDVSAHAINEAIHRETLQRLPQ